MKLLDRSGSKSWCTAAPWMHCPLLAKEWGQVGARIISYVSLCQKCLEEKHSLVTALPEDSCKLRAEHPHSKKKVFPHAQRNLLYFNMWKKHKQEGKIVVPTPLCSSTKGHPTAPTLFQVCCVSLLFFLGKRCVTEEETRCPQLSQQL